MSVARLLLAVTLVVSAAELAEGRAEQGTAQARAEAFMRAHAGNPNDEDLQQIQFHDAKAYAIVKGLLVKRELGLLDEHNPNPSMQSQKNLGPSKQDAAMLQRMEAEQSSLAPPAPMIELEGAAAPPPRPAHTASLFEDAGATGLRALAAEPPRGTGGLDLDAVLAGARSAQMRDSLLAKGGSLDQHPKAAVARTVSRKDGPSGRFWSGFGEGMLAMATRPVSAKPAPAVAMAQGAEVRPSGGAPSAHWAQTPAAVDKSSPLQSFDWTAPAQEEEQPHVASLAAQNSYLSSVGLSEDLLAPPKKNPYLASRGPGLAAQPPSFLHASA